MCVCVAVANKQSARGTMTIAQHLMACPLPSVKAITCDDGMCVHRRNVLDSAAIFDRLMRTTINDGKVANNEEV